MIPTQHAVRNIRAPRNNTAAPARALGDDSSFTPLLEVPRLI